jgi:RHS repeat-associated protein
MTAQTTTAGTCNQFQASVGTNNQLVGYQYDAAGNMTYDGVHHYTYDAENRIIQVDSGSTESYVYNENGKRVRKSMPSGAFAEFYYGPNGLVQSVWNGSSWPAEYVYAGSRLIADYTNGATDFVFTDHLGSTRLMTGVHQAVLDNMDYLPFGQQVAGGSSTTIKFTGKEHDSESGNDYFGARYYGSTMGRFLTPDWATKPAGVPYANFGNPLSLNLYNYVEDNPTTLDDADGHCDTGCMIVQSNGYGEGASVPPDNPAEFSQSAIFLSLAGDQGQKQKACPVDACVTATMPRGPDPVAVEMNMRLFMVKQAQAAGLAMWRSRLTQNVLVPVLVGIITHGEEGEAGGGVGRVPEPPADPAQSPGAGWEWRGKGAPGSSEGSWYNPSTNESLHPDLSHADVGPHWDYKDSSGNEFRIFPDGTVRPK